MELSKVLANLALALMIIAAASFDQARADPILFVSNQTTGVVGTGSVGEYDAITGAPINSALISGLGFGSGIALSGSTLFVVDAGSCSTCTGTIGEYTLSPDGTQVLSSNPTLITGLHNPGSIALWGSNLFVTNLSTGTIGEYTTSGATVNAALISGLNVPIGIAVSGSKLFVTNFGTGTVGEYTVNPNGTATTVNATLITTPRPIGIALSGPNLFVVNTDPRRTTGTGTISAYTLQPDGTAKLANAALISGLNVPDEIALLGSDIFVVNEGTLAPSTGTIGEYTTSGATVNAALVSDGTNPLSFPYSLAIGTTSATVTVSNIPVGTDTQYGYSFTGLSGEGDVFIPILDLSGIVSGSIFGANLITDPLAIQADWPGFGNSVPGSKSQFLFPQALLQVSENGATRLDFSFLDTHAPVDGPILADGVLLDPPVPGPASVPEPGTLAPFGVGLAGLCLLRRRAGKLKLTRYSELQN
jgi:hypothetical protein